LRFLLLGFLLDLVHNLGCQDALHSKFQFPVSE
jgi:hypothetical protein